MSDCCSTGCSGGGCGSLALGIVTFEMFLDDPDKFRPVMYTKSQIENLSNAGYQSYISNIKTYNSMCEMAEMPELMIDESTPWKQ